MWSWWRTRTPCARRSWPACATRGSPSAGSPTRGARARSWPPRRTWRCSTSGCPATAASRSPAGCAPAASVSIIFLTARDARRRPGGGVRARRRRLPRQAVRARGAARACPGGAAPVRPPAGACSRSGTCSSTSTAAGVTRAGRDAPLTADGAAAARVPRPPPRPGAVQGPAPTQVWGYDAYDPNLVEVHVSALRRKLERAGPRADPHRARHRLPVRAREDRLAHAPHRRRHAGRAPARAGRLRHR